MLYITVSHIRSAHIRLVNTCLKVLVYKVGRCFARVVMYAHVILRKQRPCEVSDRFTVRDI